MFAHPPFIDYALLDSGNGEKLERWGDVVVRRPDPQALWRPRRKESDWQHADLAFERDPRSNGQRGRWISARGGGKPPPWQIRWREAVFAVRPTPFKHLGVFPEQASNWEWITERRRSLGDTPKLLNLFGYTGGASVVAAQAGYRVTHVDASKTSLAWTRENAAASGLGAEDLRLLLDDALAFTRREVRRGARYDAVLLDPPHHGRGPKGETWQFELDICPLVEACAGLLAERAVLVLSTYAVGFSPLALTNLLSALDGGVQEVGELAIPEESGDPVRYLPAGFCARWQRDGVRRSSSAAEERRLRS